MSESRGPARPRVVVLGGGFAGIGAARKLKDVDVDVVLVDKHDYHTFQPLLYQVATDLLPPATVGHALRDLFHEQSNARVHKATTAGIDLEKSEVRFADMESLAYDYLVLGLGAEVNYFGVEGAAEHAFPLYTLPDAVRLKEHILERWEAADKDPSLVDDYLQVTWELRRAGIPTEFYLGKAKRLGKQLEYADAYDIPLAILVGSQEKEQGVVTIKNMAVGRAKAAALGARDEWLAARPGQTSVARGELVSGIRALLAEIER